MKVTVNNGVGVFVASFNGKLPQVMERGVFACAQVAGGEIRREVYATFKGRTGRLARSFRESFLGNAKDGIRSAGSLSDHVAAELQDQGGTVRARTVKHLSIPIPSANVPYGKWPRDYARGELHFIRSRAGNKLLVNRAGKPMFVLKTEVRIPRTGYVDRAASAAEPKMTAIVGDGIRVALGRSTP